jgi:hypothetical protein
LFAETVWQMNCTVDLNRKEKQRNMNFKTLFYILILHHFSSECFATQNCADLFLVQNESQLGLFVKSLVTGVEEQPQSFTQVDVDYLSQPEFLLFGEFIKFSKVIKEREQSSSWNINFQFYRYRTINQGGDLLETLPLGTIFSDFIHLFKQDSILGKPLMVTKNQLLDTKNTALNTLYQSYATQGQERSSNIGQYEQEDKDADYRTTHFLIAGANSEVLSHLQAQYVFRKPSQKSNTDEKLNVEIHFPEASQFIRRPGENIFVELGRYEILKANQVNNLSNKEPLSSSEGRDLLFAETWLRATQWLIEAIPNTSVVFQVNNAVYRLIKKEFYPLTLTDKMRVRIRPELPEEWLVRLSAEQIVQLRKVVFKKKLNILLNLFLNHSSNDNKNNYDEMTLTIEPNERDLFQEYRIYEFSEKFATKEQDSRYGKGVYPPVRFKEQHLQKKHLIKLGKEEALELLYNLSPP